MSTKRTFKENLTYGSDSPDARKKLGELMLFIAERRQYDPGFGPVGLNESVVCCDFLAFVKLGEPLTGLPYQKGTNGPYPVGGQDTLLQIIRDRDMITAPKGCGWRMIPHRKADLRLFTGPEVALIDDVAGVGLPTAEGLWVSEYARGEAWQAADHGGPIPYEAAFLNKEFEEEEGTRAYEIFAACERED